MNKKIILGVMSSLIIPAFVSVSCAANKEKEIKLNFYDLRRELQHVKENAFGIEGYFNGFFKLKNNLSNTLSEMGIQYFDYEIISKDLIFDQFQTIHKEYGAPIPDNPFFGEPNYLSDKSKYQLKWRLKDEYQNATFYVGNLPTNEFKHMEGYIYSLQEALYNKRTPPPQPDGTIILFDEMIKKQPGDNFMITEDKSINKYTIENNFYSYGENTISSVKPDSFEKFSTEIKESALAFDENYLMNKDVLATYQYILLLYNYLKKSNANINDYSLEIVNIYHVENTQGEVEILNYTKNEFQYSKIEELNLTEKWDKLLSIDEIPFELKLPKLKEIISDWNLIEYLYSSIMNLEYLDSNNIPEVMEKFKNYWDSKLWYMLGYWNLHSLVDVSERGLSGGN